jgi:hypothetical protein
MVWQLEDDIIRIDIDSEGLSEEVYEDLLAEEVLRQLGSGVLIN